MNSRNGAAARPASPARKILFPTLSFADARLQGVERGAWLVEGVVASDSTLIAGPPKSGKSMLVAALLAALVGGEQSFLGHRVERSATAPAVAWTDDSGAAEYAQRLDRAGVGRAAERTVFYSLPVMATTQHWEDLFIAISSAGHDLLVIDNMTQAIGGEGLNDGAAVRDFFEGVRLFTRAGIPVVVVAHTSEKFRPGGVKTPLGSTSITASVRWAAFVTALATGCTKVDFKGNHAEAHSVVLEQPRGRGVPVFRVRDAVDAVAARRASAERRADAQHENRRRGEYVLRHCQGMNQSRAAEMLEVEFSGTSNTHRKNLSLGTYQVRLTNGVWSVIEESPR